MSVNKDEMGLHRRAFFSTSPVLDLVFGSQVFKAVLMSLTGPVTLWAAIIAL